MSPVFILLSKVSMQIRLRNPCEINDFQFDLGKGVLSPWTAVSSGTKHHPTSTTTPLNASSLELWLHSSKGHQLWTNHLRNVLGRKVWRETKRPRQRVTPNLEAMVSRIDGVGNVYSSGLYILKKHKVLEHFVFFKFASYTNFFSITLKIEVMKLVTLKQRLTQRKMHVKILLANFVKKQVYHKLMSILSQVR